MLEYHIVDIIGFLLQHNGDSFSGGTDGSWWVEIIRQKFQGASSVVDFILTDYLVLGVFGCDVHEICEIDVLIFACGVIHNVCVCWLHEHRGFVVTSPFEREFVPEICNGPDVLWCWLLLLLFL